MKHLACLLVLAVVISTAAAQCPGGRCVAPSGRVVYSPAPQYAPVQWSMPIVTPSPVIMPAPAPAPVMPDDETIAAKVREIARPIVREMVAKQLAADHAAEEARLIGEIPTGVDWDKIGGKDSYSIKGRPATRDEVIEALTGDPSLADDSKRARLTIVGPEDFRKRVLSDLQTSPQAGLVLPQAYGPDHWHVTSRGYRPGVFLTRPTGETLTAPITPGDYTAERFAALMRRSDPSAPPEPKPEPKKPDPAPAPPAPAPCPAPKKSPPYLLYAALAIAVLALLRKAA